MWKLIVFHGWLSCWKLHNSTSQCHKQRHLLILFLRLGTFLKGSIWPIFFFFKYMFLTVNILNRILWTAGSVNNLQRAHDLTVWFIHHRLVCQFVSLLTFFVEVSGCVSCNRVLSTEMCFSKTWEIRSSRNYEKKNDMKSSVWGGWEDSEMLTMTC